MLEAYIKMRKGISWIFCICFCSGGQSVQGQRATLYRVLKRKRHHSRQGENSTKMQVAIGHDNDGKYFIGNREKQTLTGNKR